MSTNFSIQKLNRIVLSIFAPILILTGIAGFVIPQQYSLTSGATPYNLFHIAFGAIGLLIVTAQPQFARFFNLSFGLLDIYQAIASFFYLPPQRSFMWTPLDDLLHVVIGVGLCLIGLYGILKLKEETR